MPSNSHLQNYYNINNNHIKNTKIITVNKKLTISEGFNNSQYLLPLASTDSKSPDFPVFYS